MIFCAFRNRVFIFETEALEYCIFFSNCVSIVCVNRFQTLLEGCITTACITHVLRIHLIIDWLTLNCFWITLKCCRHYFSLKFESKPSWLHLNWGMSRIFSILFTFQPTYFKYVLGVSPFIIILDNGEWKVVKIEWTGAMCFIQSFIWITRLSFFRINQCKIEIWISFTIFRSWNVVRMVSTWASAIYFCFSQLRSFLFVLFSFRQRPWQVLKRTCKKAIWKWINFEYSRQT